MTWAECNAWCTAHRRADHQERALQANLMQLAVWGTPERLQGALEKLDGE